MKRALGAGDLIWNRPLVRQFRGSRPLQLDGIRLEFWLIESNQHGRPAPMIDYEHLAEDWHLMIYPVAAGTHPQSTFDLDFETFYDSLAAVDSLFIEPDGSFVWRHPSPAAAESPVEAGCAEAVSRQLDGVISERDCRLAHVEVKGNSLALLEMLLAKLGYPGQEMEIEQVNEGSKISAGQLLVKLRAAELGSGG